MMDDFQEFFYEAAATIEPDRLQQAHRDFAAAVAEYIAETEREGAD